MSRLMTGNRLVLAVAAALMAAGLVVVVHALSRPSHRPPVAATTVVHPASGARPVAASATADAAEPAEPPDPPEPLAASPPVRVVIPALKVDAPVGPVGLKGDGTVQVPSLRTPALTGWYSGSVTPGEAGTSVILGHVDSVRTGPAVFYKLGTLKPGDQIRVARQDGSVAAFAVESVEEFRKRNFPTERVYADTDYPSLRLITCGGGFDTRRKEYLDNTVAFARYTGKG